MDERRNGGFHSLCGSINEEESTVASGKRRLNQKRDSVHHFHHFHLDLLQYSKHIRRDEEAWLDSLIHVGIVSFRRSKRDKMAEDITHPYKQHNYGNKKI